MLTFGLHPPWHAPPVTRSASGTLMLASLLAVFTSHASAQPYRATHRVGIVRLEDTHNQTVVSILPATGNIVFEMTVKGQNVLWWPYASVDEFRKRPAFSGIPFLAPWANRLDEQAFYANGTKYNFDMELGNVRGTIPIHGLLAWADQWQVSEVKSDQTSAWVTSRLDFFKDPRLMQQFPFAHTIEITCRVHDGILQITTAIHNISTEPMPVAVGFHPYFQLTDSKRDEWTISVGARTHWLLAENKIPTGATEPIEKFFADPTRAPLEDYDIDDVFSDLIRDETRRAVMTVKGRQQQIDVLVGPMYRAMVIYAPKPSPSDLDGKSPGQSRNFICFEPMAGITDAMNLAHKGLYKELQSIPPGGMWQESFWIRPKGFEAAGGF